MLRTAPRRNIEPSSVADYHIYDAWLWILRFETGVGTCDAYEEIEKSCGAGADGVHLVLGYREAREDDVMQASSKVQEYRRLSHTGEHEIQMQSNCAYRFRSSMMNYGVNSG